MIITVIMISLYKWIKKQELKNLKAIELKEFIRSLDTEENDTVDNIILNRTKIMKTYEELKKELESLSYKIKNQEKINFSDSWKKLFEKTLKNSEINNSLKETIQSLGTFLSNYDIDIKKEKIRYIDKELSEFIKSSEIKYEKEKFYKIKMRIIISIVILILNM